MKPIYWGIYSCLVIGGSLLLYIEQLNELTRLRLEIPQLVREVKAAQEENERMQVEIDRFESPLYLMEMLKKPEFSHLKFPRQSEIIIVEESKF